MTDPRDDEALTWAGDDALQAPRGPAPRPAHPREAVPAVSGGALGLIALGVLGGVALLESVFWLRGALALQIAASVTPGSGTPGEIAAYVANLVGRGLAIVAPIVWFVLVGWRVREPTRRLAWLALGALLLVPWPAVLAAA